MSLYKKILTGLAAVLIFGNIFYLYTQYKATIQVTFSEEKLSGYPLFKDFQDKTVEHIRQKAGSIAEGSFSLGATEAAAVVFEPFFKDIQSDSLFRIKVWDKNYMVIWSNDSSVIGKSFPDNEEVKESFMGEVEAEIKLSSGKKENVGEAAFTNYSEIYVPVKNPQGQIVGSIEVYQGIDDLVSKVRSEFYTRALQTVGLSAVIFVAAAVLGKFALNF